MTGDDLKQDVLNWIEKNRNLQHNSHVWRIDLATRLATFEDMKPAWNELVKHGVGQNVIGFIFQAFEAAHKECRRLPTDDENKRIKDVVEALDKLREAIARAPFLDSAHIIGIDGKDVAFSWRETGARAAEQFKFKSIMPTICMDELLEFAQSAIPDIAAHQPARTIKRQRVKPELAAFVRHLAARFQDHYGKELMGTIARIATATYDYPDPVTKQQVERILRTPSQ